MRSKVVSLGRQRHWFPHTKRLQNLKCTVSPNVPDVSMSNIFGDGKAQHDVELPSKTSVKCGDITDGQQEDSRSPWMPEFIWLFRRVARAWLPALVTIECKSPLVPLRCSSSKRLDNPVWLTDRILAEKWGGGQFVTFRRCHPDLQIL